MVAFSSILPLQLGYVLSAGDLKLRFIHVIGKGAYGVVYLAWDLSTPPNAPKFFAVKHTLKYEANTEFAALQEQEIIYQSSMSWHPNVATLHHVVEQEHYVYFVMDYLEGGDLFAAIVDRKTFVHNDEAVRLAFVQILDAVQACHDMGLSHRDLKPENIMCSQQDSRFYLADFGLATQTGWSKSFGCGSGHYMSPECFGAIEDCIPFSTRRSDIWSLGIILVNILTGHNPWQIANLSRDRGYAQYIRGRSVFLRCILAISCDAAELISRILDPNPRTRIGLEELRRAILDIRTFFPPQGDVPDYVRAADESFRVSLERTVLGRAETEDDDGELIIDVTFEMDQPVTSSSAEFESIPLDSSLPRGHQRTFVNEMHFASSTSPSPVEAEAALSQITSPTNSPNVVPTLALAAELGHQDVKHRHVEQGKMPRNMRRFIEAVRKVALRSSVNKTLDSQ